MANKKDVVIPPIRLNSLELDKIKARADILYPSCKKRNLSKYIIGLIEADIHKTDIGCKKETQSDLWQEEIKFFALQLSKVGINVNQIAHAMNVIKKKSFVTIEDKRSFDKHYLLLSNINNQILVLKDIIKDINNKF